jgi:NADH-quinone oxidoreductase subunit I
MKMLTESAATCAACGWCSGAFRKRDTMQYPEQPVYLPPRYRGRIVLTRDPDGEERCVACNLCAVACPVGCISLQKAETEDGRWYPEFFRINFSRCIFCGMCEEACPTTAIQLTPDFELAEYNRQDLVYEKEDLLIAAPARTRTTTSIASPAWRSRASPKGAATERGGADRRQVTLLP